jgi:hypothetical protein
MNDRDDYSNNNNSFLYYLPTDLTAQGQLHNEHEQKV